MKLICTKKQLDIIDRALELYGRIRMLQLDHIIDDFEVNLLTGCGHFKIENSWISDWELRTVSKLVAGTGYKGIRDLDGEIAFAMHRQIHAGALDTPHKNCVTCDRSDLNSSEPAIKIEKEGVNTTTKGDNMLTKQELEAIKINIRTYPDPMPWDPVDSVRKLLAHTEALQLQIADLNKQLSQALTGRDK